MHSCLLLTFFPSKTVWADHKSATGDLAAVHCQQDACVTGTFAISDFDVDSTPKSENVRLTFSHSFVSISSPSSVKQIISCWKHGESVPTSPTSRLSL